MRIWATHSAAVASTQKNTDALRTLVRAAVLTNYFEVAEHAGLNPQPLLSSVALRRKLLADPENRIPLASAVALLEESARVSGCESFGLRMAELRQPSDLGKDDHVLAPGQLLGRLTIQCDRSGGDRRFGRRPIHCPEQHVEREGAADPGGVRRRCELRRIVRGGSCLQDQVARGGT